MTIEGNATAVRAMVGVNQNRSEQVATVRTLAQKIQANQAIEESFPENLTMRARIIRSFPDSTIRIA
jgi:hypothetical protein